MSAIAKNISKINNYLIGTSTLLIAISKTKPIEVILEAYEAGHRHFGENKVQEMVEKQSQLPHDIKWHMVGHLQRNKVKYIVPFVHLIHSVDSEKLLSEINKQGKKINRIISCLLQVHIAEEETKFGFSAEELRQFLAYSIHKNWDFVHVKGLMGMATFTEDEDRIKYEFTSLKKLSTELLNLKLPVGWELKELSMGMSGDYPLAVACGSTMVRVGSSLFGERNYI